MGKRFRQKDYRLKDHPILGSCRCEEHRLIAVEKLGRPLRRDEVAHHKDLDERNNDPDNIEVMTKKEHDQLHADLRRGVSRPHGPLSEETKRKISKANMGNKSRTGQKLSPEAVGQIKRIAALKPRDKTGKFAGAT